MWHKIVSIGNMTLWHSWHMLLAPLISPGPGLLHTPGSAHPLISSNCGGNTWVELLHIARWSLGTQMFDFFSFPGYQQGWNQDTRRIKMQRGSRFKEDYDTLRIKLHFLNLSQFFNFPQFFNEMKNNEEESFLSSVKCRIRTVVLWSIVT